MTITTDSFPNSVRANTKVSLTLSHLLWNYLALKEFSEARNISSKEEGCKRYPLKR